MIVMVKLFNIKYEFFFCHRLAIINCRGKIVIRIMFFLRVTINYFFVLGICFVIPFASNLRLILIIVISLFRFTCVFIYFIIVMFIIIIVLSYVFLLLMCIFLLIVVVGFLVFIFLDRKSTRLNSSHVAI